MLQKIVFHYRSGTKMKRINELILESEVCYFDAQQQVFIESVRQDKQEEQETLQEPIHLN